MGPLGCDSAVASAQSTVPFKSSALLPARDGIEGGMFLIVDVVDVVECEYTSVELRN